MCSECRFIARARLVGARESASVCAPSRVYYIDRRIYIHERRERESARASNPLSARHLETLPAAYTYLALEFPRLLLLLHAHVFSMHARRYIYTAAADEPTTRGLAALSLSHRRASTCVWMCVCVYVIYIAKNVNVARILSYSSAPFPFRAQLRVYRYIYIYIQYTPIRKSERER